MGVKGLWQLLLPIGRRINVETLERKTLAIDASIWLTQFIKAMRDEEGKLVRNAHLLGTIRRIAKLLFHKIIPVFVFDGGVPKLKLKTIQRRQQLRQRHEGGLKKTAQRILMGQLKKNKDQLRQARKTAKSNAAYAVGFSPAKENKAEERSCPVSEKEKGLKESDNTLVTAKNSQKVEDKKDTTAKSNAEQEVVEIDDEVEESEVIWESGNIRNTQVNENVVEVDSDHNDIGSDGVEWETGNQSVNHAKETINVSSEEEDEISWEAGNPSQKKGSQDERDGTDSEDLEWEMEAPDDEEDLDVDALSALPGHMKKEVLESTKRKQRLKARQAYMPVAGDPLLYSQTQIANFLKVSRLNKKIFDIEKRSQGENANDLGRSIASDSTRKFIMIKNKENPQSQRKNASDDNSDGGVYETKESTLQNSPVASEEPGGFVPERPKRNQSPPTSDALCGFFPDQEQQTTLPSTNLQAQTQGKDKENNSNQVSKHFQPSTKGPLAVKKALAVAGWSDDEDSSNDDNALDEPCTPQKTAESSLTFQASEEGQPVVKRASSVQKALAIAGWSDDEEDDKEENDIKNHQELQDLELARQLQKIEDQKKSDANRRKDETSVPPEEEKVKTDLFKVHISRNSKNLESRQGILKEMYSQFAVSEEEEITPLKKRTEFENAENKTLVQVKDDEQLARKLQTEEMLIDEGHSNSFVKTKEDSVIFGEDNGVIDLSQEENKTTNLKDSSSANDKDEAKSIEITINLDQDGLDSSNLFPASFFRSHGDCQELSSADEDSMEWEKGENFQVEPTKAPSLPIEDADSDSDVEIIEPSMPKERLDKKEQDPLAMYTQLKPSTSQHSRLSNEEALRQAMKGASKLADWAGRAVSRVVKQHIGDSQVELKSEEKETIGLESSQLEASDQISKSTPKHNVKSFGAEGLQTSSNGLHDASMDQKSVIDSVSAPSQADTLPSYDEVATKPIRMHHLASDQQFDESLQGVADHHKLLSTALHKSDDEEIDVAAEQELLKDLQKKHARDSETITEEMKEEVMELLTLFGVPFIVSPMEAEAQCAELESLGLVEGVVTDDVDAFLFGASQVYKNIFDDKKFVEAYFLRDAQLELGIGRMEMIAMALLLGSDYTDGVKGVGIVNAMEILEAFPVNNNPEGSLHQFREWLDGFDPVADTLDEQAGLLSKFHKRHKNARNRWVVDKSFPDPKIIKAYTKPQVNSSKEKFSATMPDVQGIREFCASKLGWPFFKTDEMLSPVMEQLSSPLKQTRIDSFFVSYHDNIKFARIKSKRLQMAVTDLRGGGRGESESHSKETPPRSNRKRKKEMSGGNASGKLDGKMSKKRESFSKSKNTPSPAKKKRKDQSEKTAKGRRGKKS